MEFEKLTSPELLVALQLRIELQEERESKTLEPTKLANDEVIKALLDVLLERHGSVHGYAFRSKVRTVMGGKKTRLSAGLLTDDEKRKLRVLHELAVYDPEIWKPKGDVHTAFRHHLLDRRNPAALAFGRRVTSFVPGLYRLRADVWSAVQEVLAPSVTQSVFEDAAPSVPASEEARRDASETLFAQLHAYLTDLLRSVLVQKTAAGQPGVQTHKAFPRDLERRLEKKKWPPPLSSLLGHLCLSSTTLLGKDLLSRVPRQKVTVTPDDAFGVAMRILWGGTSTPFSDKGTHARKKKTIKLVARWWAFHDLGGLKRFSDDIPQGLTRAMDAFGRSQRVAAQRALLDTTHVLSRFGEAHGSEPLDLGGWVVPEKDWLLQRYEMELKWEERNVVARVIPEERRARTPGTVRPLTHEEIKDATASAYARWQSTAPLLDRCAADVVDALAQVADEKMSAGERQVLTDKAARRLAPHIGYAYLYTRQKDILSYSVAGDTPTTEISGVPHPEEAVHKWLYAIAESHIQTKVASDLRRWRRKTPTVSLNGAEQHQTSTNEEIVARAVTDWIDLADRVEQVAYHNRDRASVEHLVHVFELWQGLLDASPAGVLIANHGEWFKRTYIDSDHYDVETPLDKLLRGDEGDKERDKRSRKLVPLIIQEIASLTEEVKPFIRFDSEIERTLKCLGMIVDRPSGDQQRGLITTVEHLPDRRSVQAIALDALFLADPKAASVQPGHVIWLAALCASPSRSTSGMIEVYADTLGYAYVPAENADGWRTLANWVDSFNPRWSVLDPSTIPEVGRPASYVAAIESIAQRLSQEARSVLRDHGLSVNAKKLDPVIAEVLSVLLGTGSSSAGAHVVALSTETMRSQLSTKFGLSSEAILSNKLGSVLREYGTTYKALPEHGVKRDDAPLLASRQFGRTDSRRWLYAKQNRSRLATYLEEASSLDEMVERIVYEHRVRTLRAAYSNHRHRLPIAVPKRSTPRAKIN